MSYTSTIGRNGLLKAAAAVLAVIVSQQASAAGFASKEQSVTYLGNAFAGTASSSLDASTNWYNTAGLTELKHSQVVGAATWVTARIKLENATARAGIPGPGPVVGASNPTEPKSSGVFPGLHAAYIINPKIALGFSISAPFGLKTSYGGNDIARYMATYSRLTTIDFSPGAAYKINNMWSVGAALDLLRVVATLNADTLTAGTRGYLNNKATGWGVGAHAGVLFKPSESTKMGLTYFSKMSPKLSGGVASFGPGVAGRSTVSGTLNLPDRIVYSITQKFDDKWSAMADVEWTHWSVFKAVRFDYNNGTNVTEDFYYKNAWRLSLGTDYHYNKCLTFKGGLSFDQTPVTDTYRGARLPDSNRYWVALGMSYKYNRNLSLDAGYAHIFFKNAPINLSTTQNRTLTGTYKASANLLGVQLVWNFV